MKFDESLKGQEFHNRYEILEFLGAGGIGRVYLVNDKKENDETKKL